MNNKVLLKYIAEVSSGQGAPQGKQYFGNDGYPFIRAGNLEFLQSGGKENCLEKINEENAQTFGLKLYPAGTILFAKSGMSATKDRVYILQMPSYIVSHLATIIPQKESDGKFLKYWFRQFLPSRLIKDKSYPSIRLSDIDEVEIPDILDNIKLKIASILEKCENTIEKRKEASRLTNEFLKSTFLEMFGDPIKNPRNWEIKKCREITKHISSGSTPLGGESTYLDKGIVFIRSQNVRMNELDFENVAFISKEVHNKMKRTWVKKGDVLLNITGASIGRVAFFKDKDDTANVNQHVCIIRPDSSKVMPEYLSFMLSTNSYQRKILSRNSGATRQAFNYEQIKNFDIPLPNMREQQNFADTLQKVEKMKEKQGESEKELSNLFNSLMQKAFRGELR